MDVEDRQKSRRTGGEGEEEQRWRRRWPAAGCCTASGSPGGGHSSREQQEVQRPPAAAHEPARTKLMGNRSDWLLPSPEQGLEGQRGGGGRVRDMEGRPDAPR